LVWRDWRGSAQAAARRFWQDDATGADFRLGPLAPKKIAFAGVAEHLFALGCWVARTPLKSLESDEGIQENPRLGVNGPEARPAIACARLGYQAGSISVGRE